MYFKKKKNPHKLSEQCLIKQTNGETEDYFMPQNQIRRITFVTLTGSNVQTAADQTQNDSSTKCPQFI
jgi:hypothetical protein